MGYEPPLQGVSVNPTHPSVPKPGAKMAAADGDDSLYPIAVLIDELRNEDVQVRLLPVGTQLGFGESGLEPFWVVQAAEERLPAQQPISGDFPSVKRG